MTSIVDSREIFQAFDITGRGECEVIEELIKEVSGESIRLDAGFNSCESWKFMYLGFFLDIYAWLKEYHQRYH